jgi:biotin carboxyl carrier protein
MRRSTGICTVILGISISTLSGCGQRPATPTASEVAPESVAAVQADALEAKAATDAREAELAAREQELADREATLKQQELEAANAAAAASAAAAAKKTASKPTTKSASASTPAKAPTPPSPIVVPAGTSLAVELAGNVNTRKIRVGDPVEGRLASDLLVGGRVAAKSGATVRGAVTEVVSGSDKIGGTPTLSLRFDTLVASDGATKTINAPYTEQGKSETAKDTAKIVGGAAAGAIIGHQVDDDKGTVIGGLLGAGAGAAAAKKTGGDIKLTAGQVLTVSTQNSFEVRG